jgi:hypothetical protein
MSDAAFPSGPWIGFYTYPGRTERFLQDLNLRFENGVMSGDGADNIGFFGIAGRYHVQERECFWTKTYHGRHSVEYQGYREKKGIWGTWTIGPTKGGFHIWPLGEGGAEAERLVASVEQELTPTLPLQIPSPAPRITTPPRSRAATRSFA